MIHAKALLAGAVIMLCVGVVTAVVNTYPWALGLLLLILVTYLSGWLYLILSGKWEGLN